MEIGKPYSFSQRQPGVANVCGWSGGRSWGSTYAEVVFQKRDGTLSEETWIACDVNESGDKGNPAAILVAAGVVLYPNGWSSVEVQQACGNLSRAYALGTCKMSWSYYITIGGSLLTFLCSGLSYNAARTKNVHYGI
uniref:Uncharacterized protein n=1 Tax=Branchiostoma floridae TaxID=7739 RepID=C3ZED1_BRAFL|eukprot:XP_002593076.1 hypothetical protein BRAFLDRAFT_72850 [Branchiostoma floridae]